jgi:uncharacterized protein
MVMNVAQLLMEPSGSRREYHLDEKISLVNDADEQQVTGRVILLRTNESIWVSAELTSHLDCECGRCLTSFDLPITMGLEEEFFPVQDPATGTRERPPGEDSDRLYINEKHTLDLSETLREYASIVAPMNPLCTPECAGICQSCGANLNDSSCVCEDAPLDPRWNALLGITPNAPDEGH